MIKFLGIDSITDDGDAECYDISNFEQDVFGGEPNFISNDVILHNCIPDYVRRRDDPTQSWRTEEHEAVADVLVDTLGVIVFQEQLTGLWQRIGGFTGPESQAARKAVAKKWKDKLKPIEGKWLKGATPVIGESGAVELWNRMETFGRYAFNRCLGKDTPLTDYHTLETRTVQEWYELDLDLTMLSDDGYGKIPNKCECIHNNGEQEVFEVEFDTGHIEFVTIDHRFKCVDGKYHTVKEIWDKGLEVAESWSCQHNLTTTIPSTC